MAVAAHRGRLIRLGLLFSAAAGFVRAQTPPPDHPAARVAPKTFGTTSYSVSSVTATAFVPVDSGTGFHTSGSLGRFGDTNVHSEFYAAVDIPQGAVIDYIGLDSLTDAPAAFTLSLYVRGNQADVVTVGSVQSTIHSGWDMDFNASPFGFQWYGFDGETLVLKVEGASLPSLQFFGFVTVLWRRNVSPAPLTATFADVPTGHPLFQYIEALAASGITGGCGGGNYCPNNPVTRGQMAVFLSKALGLHWPGNFIIPHPQPGVATTAGR
jgi:S-layer homology domain